VRPPSPSSPATLHPALQESMEGVCLFANLPCNKTTEVPPEELPGRGAAHEGGTLKRGNRITGYVRQAWRARTGHRLRIDFP